MLKTVVLLEIFVEIYIFGILWWIESSKEQHLFEIEASGSFTSGHATKHYSSSSFTTAREQEVILLYVPTSPESWNQYVEQANVNETGCDITTEMDCVLHILPFQL